MSSLEKKMKSVASVPPNYVSILQLQERWLKDKERKQKERDNGQGRREEENVMKVVEAMEPRVKLEEKSLCGEKKPTCVEKEKLGENGGKGDLRKKKEKKKKKKQSGSVEEVLKFESRVSPASIRRENNPVKGRDYMSKGETAVETQMQDMWISKRVKEEGETREFKGHGYYRNRKHEWSSRRDTRATEAMVWVKKEKKEGENGV